ncbi:hypothetical protein BDV32DRAFT_131872 [Aspergillus pseudonomiae]|nr:hypothetical protein BDV32DRAFT_131872 [Aspergillus pseudonomiae]
MQRWFAEPPHYLFYSLLLVFHAMFSEELVISLRCVFSWAPAAIVPGAVVDCKMISGTQAVLCRRCTRNVYFSCIICDG